MSSIADPQLWWRWHRWVCRWAETIIIVGVCALVVFVPQLQHTTSLVFANVAETVHTVLSPILDSGSHIMGSDGLLGASGPIHPQPDNMHQEKQTIATPRRMCNIRNPVLNAQCHLKFDSKCQVACDEQTQTSVTDENAADAKKSNTTQVETRRVDVYQLRLQHIPVTLSQTQTTPEAEAATLHNNLEVVESIERELHRQLKGQCVPSGSACAGVSPLLLWGGDLSAMRQDPQIIYTMAANKVVLPGIDDFTLDRDHVFASHDGTSVYTITVFLNETLSSAQWNDALSVAVASTQLVRVNDVHQAKGSGTLSRLLSAVLVVVCTGAFFHSLRRMGVSALLGIVGVGVQLLALSVTVALHKAYRLSLPTSMDEVMPLLYVIIGFDPLVAVARFFSSSCGALMPSTLSAHLSPVSSAPALSAQRVVGHGNGYAECGVCGDEACAMWACEHLEALRWAVRVDVLVKSGVLIELYALFKTHRYLSTALPVITFMACAYVVHKVLCGTLYLACFCVRTPQSVAMVTPVVREYQSREKISIAQVHSSVDGRDVAETCARAVTLTCAVLSLSFIQLQDGAEAKFRTVPVLAISDMSQKLLSHFRRHGNEPWVVGRHRDVFAQLYSTGDERTADSVMSGSCAVATREYWGVDDDTMRTTLQVAVVVACAFLLYNVFKTRKATAHAHAHTLTQTRTNAPAHSNSKRDRSDITGALQKDSVDGEDLRAEGGSACEVAQQHNTTATRQDAGDIKRQGTNHHNNRQNTTVYNDYGCVIGTHIISDKAPHSADTSRGIHAQAQAHIQQQQQQLQPKTSVGLLSPTNVRKVRRATYNATHLDTIHSHSNAHTHTTPHRTHHHATHTGQGTDMAIRERFFTLSSSSSSLVEDITQPNQANSTQHDSPHASTRKDSASPDRQTIVPASPTVVVTTPRGTSDKAQAADATLEGCDATDTHAHVQVKGQNAQDTLAKDVPVTTDDRTASHENSEQTSAQDAHERWIDAIHNGRAEAVSDEDVIRLVKAKRIPPHRLEKVLNDYTRGVRIRRLLLTQDAIQYHNDAHSHSDKPLTANAQMKASATNAQLLDSLPYEGMDYTKVLGVCCENVVGYVPVPVGAVGPLLLNGRRVMVPMATTEGCLLASTHRGMKALSLSGGVTCAVLRERMTRAPVVQFDTLRRCVDLCQWLAVDINFNLIKASFESTSRFARLLDVDVTVAGRQAYLRFGIETGDAMGMNMVSKGTERALATLSEQFTDMHVVSLSGNLCSDKKATAVNWVKGRGRSVVCEAVLDSSVVQTVLKTTVEALVHLNVSKNLVGSALAGSVGGFNAHAANLVTAVFIATGQDAAQNVECSNCLTLMESLDNGQRLYVSCTMPSIEVGTVGGGTQLPAQAALLDVLGVQGPNRDTPGANARMLAQIVCGTVLAGELSLMAALAAGHLVTSHLVHNRSSLNLATGQQVKDMEEQYKRVHKSYSTTVLDQAASPSP